VSNDPGVHAGTQRRFHLLATALLLTAVSLAAPASPARAGTISGTIGFPAGAVEPSRVFVEVYRAAGFFDLAGSVILEPASGWHYSFDGLPAGGYKVFYQPDGGNCLAEWWQDKSDFMSATVAMLGAGTLTLDPTLNLGGTISGTVAFEAGGLAPERVNVQIYDAATLAYAGSDWTDAAHDWVFGNVGLKTGTYRVQFTPNGGSYAAEYWQDGVQADVTVVAGNTTVINPTLDRGGAIHGTVTFAAGGVIPTSVDVQFYTAGDGSYAGYGSTNAAKGWQYSSGALPDGSYKISFSSFGGSYYPEWWENQPDQASGTAVSVTSPNLTTASPTLDSAGYISGTIAFGLGGTLPTSVNVEFYRADNGQYAASSWTDASKGWQYNSGALSDGGYTVYFNPSGGSYFSEWWENQPNQAAATAVSVTAPNATTASPTLDGGGRIAGTVGFSGGGALPSGVNVTIYRAGDGSYAGSAQANAAGGWQYASGALTSGDYKLFFSPSGGGYFAEWWQNQSDQASGTAVTVTSPDTTTANPTLDAGGTITGTIGFAPGGTRPGMVYVYVYQAGTGAYVGQTFTNAAASWNYTTPALPSGSYTLDFSPNGGDYREEWWQDQPSQGAATAVVVTAPGATTASPTLNLGATIAGTVGFAAGGTLPDSVSVSIYGAVSGSYVGSAWTDATAGWHYQSGSLPDGDYRVYFSPSGGSYKAEWWENQTNQATATTVTATAATPATVSPTLELDTIIRGTIAFQPGGTLPGYAYAYLYRASDQGMVASAYTDALSSWVYTFSGLAAGDYRIRFVPNGGTYLSEWWENQPDFAGATTVTAAAGTATANPTLNVGGSIAGTVAFTPGGTLPGYVYVYVYPAGSGDYVTYAYTDAASGWHFQTGGLPDGDYQIYCYPASGGTYLAEWWQDQPVRGSAIAVTVSAGGPAVVDPTLDPDKVIAGTVAFAAGGTLPDYLYVYLYRADTGDYVTSAFTYAYYGWSYSFPGLDGDYKVFFQPYGGTFLAEWWDNQPDQATATTVTATVGTTTLSPTLTLGKSISGTVGFSAGGTEPDSVSVYLYQGATGSYLNSASATAATGWSYTFSGLPDGGYILYFYAWGGSYLPEYWENQADYGAATVVDVTTGDATVSPTLDSRPQPPVNLAHDETSGGVVLSWEEGPTAGVTGYNVYRNVNGWGYQALTATPLAGTARTFVDTSVTVGLQHAYVVTAVKETESNASAETSLVVGAPRPPADFAGATAAGVVDLTWSRNQDPDIDHYNVYRYQPSSPDYATLADGPVSLSGFSLVGSPALPLFQDTSLSPADDYHYAVTAVDAGGLESLPSELLILNPSGLLPPTGLTAAAGSGQVQLDWADNTEGALDHYSVYRAAAGTPGFVRVDTTAAGVSAYTDTAVVNGTTYVYLVGAADAAGHLSLDTAGWVAATPGGPAVPTGLTATLGGSFVALDWADNAPSVDEYRVYRSVARGSVGTRIGAVAPSSLDDTLADVYRVYFYRVSAVVGGVESGFSPATPYADLPPTGMYLSNQSVPENSPDITVVGTLSTPDSNPTNTFTYSLASGPGDDDNASFTITGDELRTAVSFDLETKGSYSIRVRTTDADALWFEKVFVITVTNVNEAPSDLGFAFGGIAENQPPGSVAQVLYALDPDAGDSVAFTLVGGAGDADNAFFTFDGASLLTAATFDYETKNSYSIRVRATDLGGLWFEKALTVPVYNVNEPPTDVTLSSATLAENRPAGTTVGILSTTDVDLYDWYTYTLVSGPGDTDNAFFQTYGVSLQTASILDFEAKASYAIRLRSTDQGGLWSEKAFVVTVTDTNEPPTLDALAGMALVEDDGPQTIPLGGISAGTGESQPLTVTAYSSNPWVIPAPAVTYTSADATGGIAFTPNPNTWGSATITVTVGDGQAENGTFSRTFTVAVAEVNDPPTLDAISDLVIDEDTGSRTVYLSGITAGPYEYQPLTVTATSSNPGLIPHPTVTYSSGWWSGNLAITPVANATGTARITVTVDDGQAENHAATRSFDVTVNAVTPGLVKVQPNYLSPVGRTSTYRLTLQFTAAMDTAFTPAVTIASTGASSPAVPGGGTWLTTRYTNDTYTTPNIVLATGMDGTLKVSVADARSRVGRTMAPAADVFQTELDATPPVNPATVLASTSCNSATLTWDGYAAPADLAGFQVYRSTTGDFTAVDGRSFVSFIWSGYRSFTVSPLSLDTDYHLAIAAQDRVGNFTPEIVAHHVLIDQTIPPAVAIAVLPGSDPGTGVVTWTPYATATLCGFAGFRVYREEVAFSSVAGLTPVATLGVAAREYRDSGLDRAKRYHYAVVGFNGANEYLDGVTPVSWSDPYGGDVTANTTIGGGAVKEIDIVSTMTVRNGATLTIAPGTLLRFAPGTGLAVQQGKIVADGTALRPIVLTSANDRTGGTAAPGDWAGVALNGGDTGSVLRHLFVMYGQGLRLDGCAPTVQAFTALRNSGSGLLLRNGAALATTEALLQFNDVGLRAETTASVTISGSVLKNNTTHASTDGAVVNAADNWWGTNDASSLAAKVVGAVGYAPYLAYEPVLTPALATASGLSVTSSRSVPLILAGRNAEEVRLSEDSTFTGVFFQEFTPNLVFQLSEGAGQKTIFAQFKSPTATVSGTISIPVEYITQGPVIGSFTLGEGQTLSRPLTVTGAATAALGLAAIEFSVDGALVQSAVASPLAFRWDVRTLADGVHRVKLLARDFSGSFATSEKNVLIALAPPPAPAITLPADGLVRTVPDPITVQGTAEPLVQVRLSRSGYIVGTPTAAENGTFSVADVPLQEGTNDFIATATDAIGGSASSNLVRVTLDSGPPTAPILVSATARPGVGVDLVWQVAASGEAPTRFRVYRHTGPFTAPAEATLVVDNHKTMSYTDGKPADGTYTYGLVGLDGAGNASALSNLLSLAYDGTPPGFAIAYDRTQPVGVGVLNFTLTSSEALAALPSLTFRLAGTGTPISLGLVKTGDRDYAGDFEITSATPTGAVVVNVSGRDVPGNSYSGTPAGAALAIDTDGPKAALATNPVEPVHVVAPSTDVQVTLTLTEPPKAGTTPTLSFNPPVGADVTVSLSGSGTSWTGTLPLVPEMGNGIGYFAYAASDALDNAGTILTAGAALEIYNTAAPVPTAAPTAVTATPQAAGAVRIAWGAVARADSYAVYRKAGPCDVAPTALLAQGLTSLDHLDTPPADGTWCYAVTTDRRGAESPQSAGVAAVSDRLPPDAPLNLAATLGREGVKLAWDAPATGEVPARYALYRNNVKVATLNGGAGHFETNDYPGNGGVYSYEVASADPVGNENRSAPAAYNLLVGPVRNLQVLVEDNGSPALSWQSGDASVTGYNVYRGGIKLNAAPLAAAAYQDLGYSGSTRVEYAVRALNAAGDESPARMVTVYPIELAAVANPDAGGAQRALVARYFSTFALAVVNHDAAAEFPMERLQLRLTVAGVEKFTSDVAGAVVAAGGTYRQDAVIPIGVSTDDHLLRISVVQGSDVGAIVTYRRHVVFEDVVPPGVMVEMSTPQLPLAGGYSTFKVCAQNLGYADLDIVVSRANGTEPGDIAVAVANSAGMELSRGTYQGSPAGALIRIAGATRYVTVSPGQKLCADVSVLVPEAVEAGSVLTFTGSVDHFWHKLATVARANAAPIFGAMQSGITLSPYYGTAQADKDLYTDHETVTITGQAIDRQSGLPKPNAALKLGFYVRGFKWFRDLVADAAGNYIFTYNPTLGLAGEFVVWAAHPDVFDTIDQDRFDVSRLYVTPNRADIKSSKADTFNFRLELYNPGDAPMTGQLTEFRAYTLDGGNNEVAETRLHGTSDFNGAFVVNPQQRRVVNVQLAADLDAPDFANVEYRFVSAEGGSAFFEATVNLAEAVPIIAIEQPAAGFVDKSVDRSSMVNVPVRIRNNGLRALENAELIVPAAVPWMGLNTQPAANGRVPLGTIAVGETRTFDVVFSPPADAAFGYHQDKLEVTGSNAPQNFTINLYAKVTSSLTGNVQFRVVNMLGQPVAGATVRLRNTLINLDLPPLQTDDNGEAMAYGLQEGEWSYQVSASGHNTVANTVKVVADQTVLAEAFPTKSLVSISFSVVPVPYTDRYEIKIEQTFETHVPAPVLIVEPAYVSFENVEPGFETIFVATATNKGLISIRDLRISSLSSGGATLEPLITYIPELKPFEAIEVPYRVTYASTETLPGWDKDSPKNFVDCATGGFAELGNAVKSLYSAFQGDSYCATSRSNLNVAAGLLVAMHVGNAVTADPIGTVVNAISCAAQELYSPSTGSGGGQTVGPSANFPGDMACFAAGTPVLMADGRQEAVEAIAVGDLLMAADGTPARVDAVYDRETDHIRELRYQTLSEPAGGGVSGAATELRRLETTDTHLFWVEEREWTAAQDIRVGDRLVGEDGGRSVVVGNTRQARAALVYNLDVAGYRSYFANGVLAYQKCGGRPAEVSDSRLREIVNRRPWSRRASAGLTPSPGGAPDTGPGRAQATEVRP
jgi:fibronectin type 3 domain-containing protein